MSLKIKFHESTNQILVYNCEPTIQWCKNPVSLLKGFLCYIFTPGAHSMFAKCKVCKVYTVQGVQGVPTVVPVQQ